MVERHAHAAVKQSSVSNEIVNSVNLEHFFINFTSLFDIWKVPSPKTSNLKC